MKGKRPPTEDLMIDPDGVVARQSTAMLYSENPVVQRSLDYMREHLGKQFNISAVAEHSSASKRTLEMRFRESLGSSPHEFLTKLRVERAQALLLMPEKSSIEQIAGECGFGTAATFYAAFRRQTGRSPATFRRESGRGALRTGARRRPGSRLGERSGPRCRNFPTRRRRLAAGKKCA